MTAAAPSPTAKRQLICVDCEVSWQAGGAQQCWVCGQLAGVVITAAWPTNAMLFGHLPDLRSRLNQKRVAQ